MNKMQPRVTRAIALSEGLNKIGEEDGMQQVSLDIDVCMCRVGVVTFEK